MSARSKSRAWRNASALLIACAALISPPVAHAEAVSADAAVVIIEPVGAGFSFDILSDAVSAVFLNGDAGDSVSLLMSRRKPGTRGTPRNESGVLVMASGVYRIDLLQPVASSARARAALRGSAQTPAAGGSSILFLAQFN
ncbi:MAG: hypothetical protein ACO1OX_15290 [Novosphingobium sp.]